MLGAYGDLNKTFGTLSRTAPGLLGAGSSATGRASDYFSKILSGDPNAVAAAIAPEANTIATQQDQARKALTMEGNRTGGETSTVAGMGERGRGMISDLLARSRGQAAGELGRIGSQETGQGLSAEGEAGNVAANILAGATKARQQSQKIHDQAVQAWADAVANTATGQSLGNLWTKL